MHSGLLKISQNLMHSGGKKKKVSCSCFSSPHAKLLNVVKDSMGGGVILLGSFVVCFCLVVF